MNRIALMIFRNIFKFPGLYGKLCKYANTVGTYPEAEAYAHIHGMLKLGVESGNIDLHVTGKENIPTDGGFLMYSNHQGLFDVVAIVASCDTPISAVFKKEIENYPLIKQIATCLKGLPMDRKDPRQSLQVIQEVTKEVMAGRRYLIFPEGTRSKKGNEMIDFHGGSFRCAVKAKCPIIPICIVDGFKVFDVKGSKPVSCQVHYLPAIQPEEFEGMKANDVADLVKARIQEALDKYAN